MKKDYNKWSREELLYEVKRLNTELEKVKQLKRLTDDRFVGEQLRKSGKSFSKIAEECGLKTRQQAYEIYQRSIANGY